MSLKNKIILCFIMFMMLITTGSSIYFWYKERNKPPTSRVEYIKVPEIKEVIKLKRVEVPGPERVVTIEKVKIVEKLKLPDWFKQDEDKQAIASAVIAPYKGKTNVVGIIDTKTGVGDIIAKQEPLPFMGFENEKEIYGKIGYSTEKNPQITIGGRWLFGRVGNVKIGVYGEGRANFATEDNRPANEASAGLIITY